MEREGRDEREHGLPRLTPDEGGAAGSADGPVGLSASDLEEHEWIRRAQQGEEVAYERLVRAHERRAWRVARNLIPNDEDAHDLVQDAFLRVFRHIDRFDFRFAFSTWLYRIVTNLAIDHLRKRRPVHSTTSADEEQPDLALPDPSAPSPSAALESRETSDEVRACLDRLAPHFQSALVLRELEGLACTEIAEIVGATHVTVRWRLHRGRKLFLEEWERRRRFADSSGGRAANARRRVHVEGGTGAEGHAAAEDDG